MKANVTFKLIHPDSEEVWSTHNIFTNEGDAMVADLCAETPVRTKVNNSNGYIALGTGDTGPAKTDSGLAGTIIDSAAGMDATYPKIKGAFGATDDNVVQYQATFPIGSFAGEIAKEALLMNGADPATADIMARSLVDPPKTLTSVDQLVVTWEITHYEAA